MTQICQSDYAVCNAPATHLVSVWCCEIYDNLPVCGSHIEGYNATSSCDMEVVTI